MWATEKDDRLRTVEKKISKVKSALADTQARRSEQYVNPKLWWHLTDLLEELLDDLYALIQKRELLRGA
jgi:tryptophan 2,3-dioxygenase